jgi:arylsulfatase
MKVGNETFKVHLDGFNMLPYLTGQTKEDPRNSFIYFSDEADLTAMRYDNFKVVFMEQRATGTMQIWAEPFVPLRLPKIFNLRTDPYERADITSNTYWDWIFDHAFIYVPVQVEVGEFLSSFKEYPPSQKTGSFSVDKVIEQLQNNTSQH